MVVNSYSFKADKEGPSILILGAIHGNEKCGSRAAMKVVKQLEDKELKLLSGSVTFVPICNQKAYDADKRYIDLNLNRVMKQHDKPEAYEEHLANALVPMIQSHDFTLDLHSIHSEGSSFAFLDFPNKDAASVCSVLGVGTIITGWPDMYSDDEEDLTTLSCAHLAGKASVTVECGQHYDPNSDKVAEAAILNTLKCFGMIEGDVVKDDNCKFVQAKHRIVKTANGILGDGTVNTIKHMNPVKKGEKIAEFDNGDIVKSPEDGVILIPYVEAQIGDEWFYIGCEISK